MPEALTYNPQFLRKAFHPGFVGPATSPVPVRLFSDDFNRANSTTVLGVNVGVGTLAPQTWTALSGVWGINSNRAYAPTSGAATLSLGVSDVDVTVTTVVADVNARAILIRLSDASNYIQMIGDSTQCRLQKVVAGVTSTLLTTFGTLAAGTVMRITASGSALAVYLDGVLKGSVTETFNQSATKHGLLSLGTSQRFDDWSVYSV